DRAAPSFPTSDGRELRRRSSVGTHGPDALVPRAEETASIRESCSPEARIASSMVLASRWEAFHAASVLGHPPPRPPSSGSNQISRVRAWRGATACLALWTEPPRRSQPGRETRSAGTDTTRSQAVYNDRAVGHADSSRPSPGGHQAETHDSGRA